MTPDKWRWLMFCARQHAAIYQQRARVVAIRLPPRAARRRGTPWTYIIEAPSSEAING